MSNIGGGGAAAPPPPPPPGSYAPDTERRDSISASFTCLRIAFTESTRTA